MNSNVHRYIVEQLAASGFVVLAARMAFILRPDIWATRMNCGMDFTDAIPKLREFIGSLPGVMLLEIQLEGSPGWAMFATRSTDMLTQRLEWITGESLKGLRPLTEVKPKPAGRAVEDADPIPSWPCIERTERLRALGIKDELASGNTAFPPRRSSL